MATGPDRLIFAWTGTIKGDSYITYAASRLGLRTVAAVGGGRYRIEAEELGTLLKLAEDMTELQNEELERGELQHQEPPHQGAEERDHEDSRGSHRGRSTPPTVGDNGGWWDSFFTDQPGDTFPPTS